MFLALCDDFLLALFKNICRIVKQQIGLHGHTWLHGCLFVDTSLVTALPQSHASLLTELVLSTGNLTPIHRNQSDFLYRTEQSLGLLARISISSGLSWNLSLEILIERYNIITPSHVVSVLQTNGHAAPFFFSQVHIVLRVNAKIYS